MTPGSRRVVSGAGYRPGVAAGLHVYIDPGADLRDVLAAISEAAEVARDAYREEERGDLHYNARPILPVVAP